MTNCRRSAARSRLRRRVVAAWWGSRQRQLHVGYANPYAFSHAFKKQFGTSPGRYRHDRGTSAIDR
ncbi:AraC family transcriptional regulator [Nocardia africana]|uniref:AraC family transcriptional regulator n=1 Tax=Nocardia africana TaxID=134964 RepID=A0ABW6NTJ2_9NOCA